MPRLETSYGVDLPYVQQNDPATVGSISESEDSQFDYIERQIAAASLPVIPLQPGGNRPAVRDWPRRARRGAEGLTSWRQEIPNCNFGIVTGGGVGVIDLDTKNAPEGSVGGFATIIEVEEILCLGGALSHLPRVRTFSGEHIYFRYEGALPSRVPWLPYIDIMADGGRQVAAPGTVRTVEGVTRTYELVHGSLGAIPFAPSELIEALRYWSGPGRSNGRRAVLAGIALPSTQTALRDGLPPGARNDLMHRLACRWWLKLGLTNAAEAEVYGLARQVWDATPQRVPFPWSEALAAVRSARRFVEEQDYRNRQTITAWLREAGEA